jgi:5'-nucleotidase
VRVLVTNDDGIGAYGLRALAHALAVRHAVTVVAPERERSASGHSITLHRPVHAIPERWGDGIEAWAVTGTPADCVKLGVQGLLAEPPDLVVAGINHGANLGRDIFYSGTVSAAIEAHFLGCPAWAVSLAEPTEPDLEAAARAVAHWLDREGPVPSWLLNINFPAGSRALTPLYPRPARLGRRDYVSELERRVDPQGRTYFWMAGRVREAPEPPDTDVGVVRAGFVAVTPLTLAVTAESVLPTLATWLATVAGLADTPAGKASREGGDRSDRQTSEPDPSSRRRGAGAPEGGRGSRPGPGR